MKQNKTVDQEIELTADATNRIAQDLAVILSDTYILYVKTQNFHWNVTDPRFYALHKMLEEQYEELAEATDEIAERIRMIGHRSPAGLRQFLEMGTLEDSPNDLSGNQMLEQLLRDHDTIIRNLRQKIEEFIDLDDQGSGDLLIQRLRAHEKTAWMLRSHLKNI